MVAQIPKMLQKCSIALIRNKETKVQDPPMYKLEIKCFQLPKPPFFDLNDCGWSSFMPRSSTIFMMKLFIKAHFWNGTPKECKFNSDIS